MLKSEPVFAPKEVFEQALEHFVIPTFDLVIVVPEKGVLMVRRKIAPYSGKWALPGLRMYKNETIDDTLRRIAFQEAGIKINIDEKRLLGQFVGKFKTEHSRQDLSTGYAVIGQSSEVLINPEHYTKHLYIQDKSQIPTNCGAMYLYYLEQFFVV